ncbi:MAG: sulfotransferase [Bacteroidales bacterium]
MGLNFQKLPVNTLIGASWNTFNKICKGREVDPGYRNKYLFTKLVCRILSAPNIIEDYKFRAKLDKAEIKEAPVFIIGHWRSGTTFMHNVFACDKQFGYTTTYQTVFPFLMLFMQKFFKKIAAISMPKKRPTDNLELNTDQPQEEEFAMSNMTPYSFYNFWIFPKYTAEYRDRYLLFNNIGKQELKDYKEAYKRLIKLSLWNTKGERYLSKNPPNTGRIPQLLEMFPNAKFIYLVRNPYTVYESTRNYFTNTIRPLKFQDYEDSQMENDILENYTQLYFKYEKDKILIPEGNLVEIKFEDYEADPLNKTREIYERLSLHGFEKARPAIETYVNKKRGYKKNKYRYEESTKDIVERHWGFALTKWGYK